MEAFRLGAKQAARLIERGELTAQALVQSCRERIREREPQVQAWTHVAEPVVASARGPLFGVPVGVKDIFDTHDMPTEYGSPIYAGHRPRADAAVVSVTRRAQANAATVPTGPAPTTTMFRLLMGARRLY